MKFSPVPRIELSTTIRAPILIRNAELKAVAEPPERWRRYLPVEN